MYIDNIDETFLQDFFNSELNAWIYSVDLNLQCGSLTNDSIEFVNNKLRL